MRMKLFTIPVFNLGDGSQELERFIASHRILKIHRQFVQDGENSAWCFCVDYEEKTNRAGTSRKDRIDYREVLNDQDFSVYSRLRDLRKELAARQGIALYAIFTTNGPRCAGSPRWMPGERSPVGRLFCQTRLLLIQNR